VKICAAEGIHRSELAMFNAPFSDYLDPETEPFGCRVERLSLQEWMAIDFGDWINERIGVLQKALKTGRRILGRTRAIVVVVSTGGRWEIDGLLEEIVELARAYGAVGLRAKTKDEVEPVIKEALATDNLVIMDFAISREEGVFPMVPAGKATTEMLLV
jgi:hypothetical protein